MTGSNSPPNGADNAAARSRAAVTPSAKVAPASLQASEQQRARQAGPAPAAGDGAPGAPRPPRAAAASGVAKPANAVSAGSVPEPTTNGAAGAPEAAVKRAAVPSEPYPPLSERMVNGIGADTNSKNSKRITPRSPRTALEPDQVDMPARRSKTARNPFVIVGNAIITLFVLAAVAGGVGLVIGKQRFEAPGPLAADRIVNIPHGSGIRDIADVLTREGVIDQPWVFVGGILVLKAREDLKAGEYQFKAHASLRDIVATIVDGRVVTHQFTVPEGLTSEQIVARLLNDDVLTGNIKEIPREGSLLPDTYNFGRGLTREQMIQRMQQTQQRLVKEIWDHRSPDLPIKTPEQLVILASIVEKETGKPDERTRVAAVFVNRLKQRMRLQSDPTIIYGLVGGKGTLGRPIMRSEIDQPTPYNTYQIDGLPPGPIANPGRASLEAAANPARTRELYFVADGTGGHAFAETYEQHQKNVTRLRQMESDQKEQSPPGAQLVSSPPAAPAAPVPAAQAHRSPSNHHKQTAP